MTARRVLPASAPPTRSSPPTLRIARAVPAQHSPDRTRASQYHRRKHPVRTINERKVLVGILGWIILGLLAGAVAKILLPGRDPGGLLATTLIGIAGAFVGGWLSSSLLDRPISKQFFDLPTWGAAIAGSLVLLIGYRLLFGNSR